MTVKRYRRGVTYLAKRDRILRRIIRDIGPPAFRQKKRTIFEALIRAVAHQQLNGKAARQILARFLALFQRKRIFPKPEAVLRLSPKKLRRAGFSAAKARAIRDIAKHAAKKSIPTNGEASRMTDEEIIRALTPLRGVGRWTAEMILIFTLGRTDVLPVDDFGIREGFRIAYKKRVRPKPEALASFGKRWAPWRTLASWYLWRVADTSKKRFPAPEKRGLAGSRGGRTGPVISSRGQPRGRRAHQKYRG